MKDIYFNNLLAMIIGLVIGVIIGFYAGFEANITITHQGITFPVNGNWTRMADALEKIAERIADK